MMEKRIGIKRKKKNQVAAAIHPQSPGFISLKLLLHQVVLLLVCRHVSYILHIMPTASFLLS